MKSAQLRHQVSEVRQQNVEPSRQAVDLFQFLCR